MSDPNKVKIEIETTATGNGASVATRDLEGLGAAGGRARKGTEEAKQGADGLAGAVEGLAKKSNPAREAIEGLERASSGGAGSIFALAKAFKGLLEIGTSASPFGLLVTALSAVLGVGLLLKEKFFEPAEKGFEKTSEAAEKTADRMNKVQQAELHFEKQKQELEQLKEKFNEDTAAADTFFKAQERLANANLGKKIAQIDLNEQKALAKAGGNEDRKKEISTQAEADRTLVRSSADQEKNALEQQKADGDINRLKQQRAEEEKKLDELAKTQRESEEAAQEIRKRASALNVKSDQQRKLDEIDELKRVQANETAKPGFTADDFGPGETGKRLAESANKQRQDGLDARALKIRQVDREAPDLSRQINEGKETFDLEAERRKDELDNAKKAGGRSPSLSEQNTIAAAQARVDTVADLKSLPDREKQAKADEELIANRRKTLADLDRQLLEKNAEKGALEIEETTGRISSKASLLKINNGIAEENQKRSKATDKAASENAATGDQRASIDDQLSRVFSGSDEGKKLLAQRATLDAKGTATPGAAPFSIPEVDKALRKPSPLAPDAGSKDDSAAKAIDNGAEALQQTKERIKPIPEDALSKHVDEVNAGLATSNEATSTALQSLATAAQAIVQQQQQFAEQQKALANRVDQLASQVANARS